MGQGYLGSSLSTCRYASGIAPVEGSHDGAEGIAVRMQQAQNSGVQRWLDLGKPSHRWSDSSSMHSGEFSRRSARGTRSRNTPQSERERKHDQWKLDCYKRRGNVLTEMPATHCTTNDDDGAPLNTRPSKPSQFLERIAPPMVPGVESSRDIESGSQLSSGKGKVEQEHHRVASKVISCRKDSEDTHPHDSFASSTDVGEGPDIVIFHKSSGASESSIEEFRFEEPRHREVPPRKLSSQAIPRRTPRSHSSSMRSSVATLESNMLLEQHEQALVRVVLDQSLRDLDALAPKISIFGEQRHMEESLTSLRLDQLHEHPRELLVIQPQASLDTISDIDSICSGEGASPYQSTDSVDSWRREEPYLDVNGYYSSGNLSSNVAAHHRASRYDSFRSDEGPRSKYLTRQQATVSHADEAREPSYRHRSFDSFDHGLLRTQGTESDDEDVEVSHQSPIRMPNPIRPVRLDDWVKPLDKARRR